MEDTSSVIWLSSYPKSGNTWVNSVLKRSSKDGGMPKNDMDVYNLIAAKIKPEPSSIVTKDVCIKPTSILKTHAQFSNSIHQNLNLNTVGFCHIIRNPLDMLLSYINFTRIQYGRWRDNKQFLESLFINFLGLEEIPPYDQWLDSTIDNIPKKNLDYALNKFNQNGGNIPSFTNMSNSWFNHTESWITASQSLPSVRIRYEDLIGNTDEFYKLKKLFNLEKEDIRKAIETTNSKSLKNDNAPTNKDVKLENEIFYNKMRSYYYNEYFSRSLIEEFIDNNKDQLTDFGYANLPV
tara:strand:+ start:962 stop:1840 length:879 start_codon:yes stop_codon:yes gene_type:complete